MKNNIIVLRKREGKHARDKSQHADAYLQFSKKTNGKEKRNDIYMLWVYTKLMK